MSECTPRDPEFRFTSHHGNQTVEVAIHGDSTIGEVVGAFQAFLLAAGFHPENVNEVLPP